MKIKLEHFSKLKYWLKGDGEFEISWGGYSKVFSIRDFRRIRRGNKLEYPNDPDVNVKRQWGIRTNGAKRGVKEHKCLDWYLMLGHIEINYTNFEFNKGIT